jgi:hypothetical protein
MLVWAATLVLLLSTTAAAPASSCPAMPPATRTERDTFGPIQVPADRLYGAQTQRSLNFFKISTEKLPSELILALVHVKRASAVANKDLGLLDARKAAAIVYACDDVLQGKVSLGLEFPLSVWQTGSGTQSNMNANEVLANLASEKLGGQRGESRLVHPNDDVNLGTSSNDVFPTAMHVAAALGIQNAVLPALRELRATLHAKSGEFMHIIKIGRTHLQDATPLTLGQGARAEAGWGWTDRARPFARRVLRVCGAAGLGRAQHPEGLAGRARAGAGRVGSGHWAQLPPRAGASRGPRAVRAPARRVCQRAQQVRRARGVRCAPPAPLFRSLRCVRAETDWSPHTAR